MGTAWRGLDHNEDPEEEVRGADDGEAGLTHQIEWPPIPVASHLPRMLLGRTILPSPQPLAVAAAVLHQENVAVAPAHPSHLAKRDGGMGNVQTLMVDTTVSKW